MRHPAKIQKRGKGNAMRPRDHRVAGNRLPMVPAAGSRGRPRCMLVGCPFGSPAKSNSNSSNSWQTSAGIPGSDFPPEGRQLPAAEVIAAPSFARGAVPCLPGSCSEPQPPPTNSPQYHTITTLNPTKVTPNHTQQHSNPQRPRQTRTRRRSVISSSFSVPSPLCSGSVPAPFLLRFLPIRAFMTP